jgi:hypothetical protein
MIFLPKSLVPLLTFKAKKVVFPISFSTVEKCTMPYCCSRYLLSLVIPKVMMDFAVDTTVAVACLCRHCNIPRSQTDNVDYEWEHILPELVQSVIDANNKEGLKALSQHPIRNAFYKGICLGGNKRGIHGMLPGEPLHALELGLFKMMIKRFYVNLGYKPGSTLYPKILQLLDVWARRIGSALGHQSDRKMPRTYFPNCVAGGTKLAGHEMNSIILVLLILCKMKESHKLLLSSKYFLEDHLRG